MARFSLSNCRGVGATCSGRTSLTVALVGRGAGGRSVSFFSLFGTGVYFFPHSVKFPFNAWELDGTCLQVPCKFPASSLQVPCICDTSALLIFRTCICVADIHGGIRGFCTRCIYAIFWRCIALQINRICGCIADAGNLQGTCREHAGARYCLHT
jgi:hypothetical protein